jgi:hypothetical protein
MKLLRFTSVLLFIPVPLSCNHTLDLLLGFSAPMIALVCPSAKTWVSKDLPFLDYVPGESKLNPWFWQKLKSGRRSDDKAESKILESAEILE